MDSTLHSILAAQLIQDRIAKTASANASRQAKRAGWLDPEPRPALRRLRRAWSRRRAVAAAPPR